MDTTTISNRSMQYEMQALSGSLKMERKMEEGGGTTSDLAAKLEQFGIDISIHTRNQIFGQTDEPGDDLMERLRAFQKGADDAASDGGISDVTSGADVMDEMFGEDGYWGVKQTAGRISEFVLQGAGDDLQRLKEGREGMLQGFKEAEKMRGGTLPDISYETMTKSLEAVDARIRELGGSVIDLSA